MAHPGRCLRCCQRWLQCLPLRPEVDHRVGDLGRVRDLDPAEAVPAAELDALAQPVVGADHPATHIFGVAQPAQGCRLQLGRSGLAREIEAPAVLAQAARDVAAGKAEIAAQVVDARGLGEETLRSRGCLGALQVGKRPVKIVGHALDRGKADPGPAALGVARGHVKRPLVGHERLGHHAEVVQDVALEQGEREPVRLRGRKLKPRRTSRSAAS